MTNAVLIPSLDGKLALETAQGLHECRAHVWDIHFAPFCADVRLARNLLLNAYLQKSPHDTAWLIDADIGFSNVSWGLLERHQTDIACGVYPMRCPPYRAVRNGLGFVRVARSGLEKMARHAEHFTLQLPDEQTLSLLDFVPSGIASDTRTWVPEDAGFYQLARRAGIEPVTDAEARLVHGGHAAYSLPAVNRTSTPA